MYMLYPTRKDTGAKQCCINLTKLVSKSVTEKLELWSSTLESKEFQDKYNRDWILCTALLVSIKKVKLRWNQTGLRCLIANNLEFRTDIPGKWYDRWRCYTHKKNRMVSTTKMSCDRRVPIKVKDKFYTTDLRPTILHGSECWASKVQHNIHKMQMLKSSPVIQD